MFPSITNAVIVRLITVLAAACAAALPSGCASQSTSYSGQRVFDRPEGAAESLAAAVSSGQVGEIEAIFGSQAHQVLSSGDPVADRRSREVVAVAMNERWRLESKDSCRYELVIGDEDWPFPIPLVKDQRGWWFDTAAGAEEVRMRRIGRNELATIQSLRTYVSAQREYAAVGRDGKPAGVFAQQIRSDTGKHNGLYWPATGVHESPSPLGELIAAATAEGYGQSKEGAAPFRGYYYRIVTEQGNAASGGAMSYVVNGDMTRGFAMIAYPAEYESSGVMTFMVGVDGTVYERDLGNGTAEVARGMITYNPDGNWAIVR